MSTHANQNLRFWKDVVENLRRGSYQFSAGHGCFLRNGTYHSVRNIANLDQSRTIADGYALMLMTWTDLTSPPLTNVQVMNLVHNLKKIPVLDVCATLKDADTFLLKQIQEEEICTFSDFKHQIAELHPLGKCLLTSLQGLWNEMRYATNRALAAGDLHTMLSFITRLNIRGRKDLNEEAKQAFLEQEDKLASQFVYTTEEQAILTEWFQNTAETHTRIYGDWMPQHGDGAVADENQPDIADKYRAFGTDDDLEYLDLLNGGLCFPRKLPKLKRIAKVQFVPKSVDKLRTICMEPATLMFYQQGYRRSIVRYINSHKILRGRIALDKAYLNAALACYGSIDGSLSTIDLSNASDSVSVRLIRQWFAHTPLYDCLMATRSTHYRLDDVVKPTAKFAPMGSALCFPIECLCFAAMCEATIRASGESPHRSVYRVYGDDIIIETKYAEALIERLGANGFTVNTAKSYYTVKPHNFRESCGGEFLDGFPMTPFRISRKFETFDIDGLSGRYEALVDLANDSYYHLPTVRRFVVSALLNLPKRFRPIFEDSYVGKGVLTDTLTNYQLNQRYSKAFQRVQYQHGAARAPKGLIELDDEDIRYYEWLRSTYGRPRSADLSQSALFIAHYPSKFTPITKRLRSVWE